MSKPNMKKAILLTAYNRPDYLAEVLDSWTEVRGIRDWQFIISHDDSGSQSEEVGRSLEVARYFQLQSDVRLMNSIRPDNPGPSMVQMWEQPEKLGVLRHPLVALNKAFEEYDFVVRVEDDLVVSDGILEYFEYAAETFQHTDDVKTVHAYSKRDIGRESVYRAVKGFNSWGFGAWRRSWPDLRDNWDADYSTYNGHPGVQSGFDWHFDTRVYPARNWYGLYPEVSRVKNIGAFGVHGTPENLPKSPTFVNKNEIRGAHFDLQL